MRTASSQTERKQLIKLAVEISSSRLDHLLADPGELQLSVVATDLCL